MAAGRLSLEVADGIDPLAEEWGTLAERVGAAPFVRPGWVRAWHASFGGGPLRLLAVRRGGQLVAVAPLQKRRGALRSPTNPHTPAFDLVALDEEAGRALAGSIFANAGRAVTLEFLDARGTALAALREAAQAAGYRAVVTPAARSPYIPSQRSLAAHERSLSRNLRHDVERRLRRLCDEGAVSVEVAHGRERLDQLLEEAFRIEALGWKGAGGTAIASQPQTRGFYTEVARWAASLGWLRLAFLRLDERAIAFQFDLEGERTYYSLKVGYDPEYERFSPGKLLAYAMVSRAISSGLASYELLGREEEWKRRWTDAFRERVTLLAFARGPAGFLTWSAFAYGRPLACRVPGARRVAAALRK
jgi:CelD/BcsL family acetyltransferase involved in cellulose biosynthesis